MLDERDDVVDNEPTEEVDNVQIGDVVVDRMMFKDAKTALVTLNFFGNKDLLKLHLSTMAFKHFQGNT